MSLQRALQLKRHSLSLSLNLPSFTGREGGTAVVLWILSLDLSLALNLNLGLVLGLAGWCHGVLTSERQLVQVLDFPDLGGVVGGAGGEVLDVRGEEDAGYVLLVRFEVGYWDEGCFFAVLFHAPDEDVALVACQLRQFQQKESGGWFCNSHCCFLRKAYFHPMRLLPNSLVRLPRVSIGASKSSPPNPKS